MLSLFRRAPRVVVTAPAIPATLELAGRRVPVRLVRHVRARRLTLRADPAHGEVRLTLPRRAALATAAIMLAAQHRWLAEQVARWPAATPFAPGASIPFDGGTLIIDWSAAHPRGVSRAGDRLVVGGLLETLPGRLTRWLKAQALADLAPATQALAGTLGRPVARIAIRDAAGRWGSCAVRPSGATINYSWRLILAPAWVRHAVVAHEAAHLVHADHGREFWALAAELQGDDPRASRRWLREHGAALHWVGRPA